MIGNTSVDGTARSFQRFDYDGTYRLVSATGCFSAGERLADRYELTQAFDSIHRLRQKVVTRTLQDGPTSEEASYTWTFGFDDEPDLERSYVPQAHAPQRVASIASTSEESVGAAEASRLIGYDSNGNVRSWRGLSLIHI